MYRLPATGSHIYKDRLPAVSYKCFAGP